MPNKTYHFHKVLQIENAELWDFYEESSCLKRNETFGVFFCEEVKMCVFRFGTSLYSLDKEMRITRSFNVKNSQHSFLLPGTHGFSVLKFHSEPMPPSFPKFMEILQEHCQIINNRELDNYLNFKETESFEHKKETEELTEDFTLHRKKIQELSETAQQIVDRQKKIGLELEQPDIGLLTPEKKGMKGEREGEQENTQASTKNTLSMESLEQQHTEEKPRKMRAFDEEEEAEEMAKVEGSAEKSSQRQKEKTDEEEEETHLTKPYAFDSFWLEKKASPILDLIAFSIGTFMSIFQSDEYIEEFKRKYGSEDQGKKSWLGEEEEEKTYSSRSSQEYPSNEEEQLRGRQYEERESPKYQQKERDENEFWLPEETPPPGHESSQRTYPVEERIPLLDKITAGYGKISESMRKLKNLFTPAKKEISLKFE